MAAFFVYVIKSSLLLAMLVSLFMLFMSRETFHRLNRWLLLFVVMLSLVLPLVNVGVSTPLQGLFTAIENSFIYDDGQAHGVGVVVDETFDITQLPDSNGDVLPMTDGVPIAETITPIADEKENERPLWQVVLFAVYGIGVVLLVVRQVVMYLQVARIIARSSAVSSGIYGLDNVKLCVHNGKERPFSWLAWVVVSNEDMREDAREILIHEAAHVRAGHSLDIMLADVVIMLQWFNPLAWIMKSTLMDIHEFEADEAVLASGVNARQYQLLIIKKAVGTRLYSIANSFNHSLTKKRITMMCKEKSKKWRCAKALYIVPVAAVAALSFSTVETANATVGETLVKGNEIVANNEKGVIENFVGNDANGVESQFADGLTMGVPDVKAVGICNEVNGADAPKSVNVKNEIVVDDEKVYMVCETAPEFPGGAEAMMKYLSQNIKYPAAAADAGKEGRAAVQFIVKKDGSISDVKIVRSTNDKSLDAEALRVVSSMPKWKPGMQAGKAVNVNFVLPIVFKLQNKETKAPAIELKGGGVAISKADSLNAVIVVNGAIYNGNIGDIDSNTIESITVVKIEALPAEEAAKCKQLGKNGVIYIQRKKSEPSTAIGNEAVFQLCEQQPEFPGGEQEMMKYINRTIKYPSEAREINAQGRFLVNFIVKKDGTICDVKVVKHNASSTYSDISAVAALEKHVENSQASLERSLNQLKELENTIAKLEKQYDVLKKDNTAGVILERRQDELEKARADFENNSKRIDVVRAEIEALKQRVETAKKNVNDVMVVAYKNSSSGYQTAEELAELDAKATQALIDEAVRVVSGMPNWKPGMQGGKPVNATFTLPIIYRLQ